MAAVMLVYIACVIMSIVPRSLASDHLTLGQEKMCVGGAPIDTADTVLVTRYKVDPVLTIHSRL